MFHRVLSIFRGLRTEASFLLWLLAAPVIFPGPALAQNSTPPQATDQQQAANPDGVAADDYAEAQHLINGPAGNPECVWLGRKVVNRLWNDDMDTAFRHLDLYDRFGCPGAHVQAAVRCIVLNPPNPGDRKPADQKPSDTLDFRVKACWNNPASPAIPAVAPTATPASAPAAAPAAAAPSPPAAH